MPPVLSLCPILTPLRVIPLFSPQPTTTPPQPSQHRKLFIGGLNHETTDDQLCDYYSKWGQVVDCIKWLMQRWLNDLTQLGGRQIVDPKRAIPREQMLQAALCPPTFLDSEPDLECKLMLSGILWDFHTVDDLRLYFERFGELEQVEILGYPKGCGFIEYLCLCE
uniref:RRM domain-containing protein n=2 Tax=Meloidogyne javanica TaxID=6303 RepID=A0A915M567_MELJA